METLLYFAIMGVFVGVGIGIAIMRFRKPPIKESEWKVAIDNAMVDINFRKIAVAMKAVGWTYSRINWSSQDTVSSEEDFIPDEGYLQMTAEECAGRAIDQVNDGEKRGFSATGGFEVEAFVEHGEPKVNIIFVLEESSDRF